MSDKVFFLRFKDHCATLNMFVTFYSDAGGTEAGGEAAGETITGLHRNFIGSGSR